MAGLQKAKKTKKQRKYGRNAAYCLTYKNTNRREKNKIKKLVKHLVKFANDDCAKNAIKNAKIAIGIK
jgi:hypothetical protein